jgi:hypothetical protein
MVTHLYGDVQTFQDVSDLCNNVTSIWTIHLSSALLQLNIPHCITTTCAGVNQDLESLSFYVDHIENEKQEVMSLFENSIKAGTQIIEWILCHKFSCIIINKARYFDIAGRYSWSTV